MKKVSAKTAKEFLDIVLTSARKEPVMIEQDGIEIAVVMCPEDYLLMESMETEYLSQYQDPVAPEPVKEFEGFELEQLPSSLLN